MSTYWAERAWLPRGVRERVRFEVEDGVFTSITPDAPAEGAHRLPGLVLPGFANDHSHAFHRALRGRTHADGGTFWTWRKAMYSVAAQLDPDSYYQLARATYAEMVLAGYTSVSEFHYLHHGPGGTPYDDPNAMGHALIQAAQDAGISITLLDTCYLHGGLGPEGYLELDEVQTRFADRDVSAWADRVSRLWQDDGVSIGTAAHSVRALTPDELAEFAHAAPHLDQGVYGASHIHLSEQPAENEATVAHFGRTPTQLLSDAQLLDPRLTVVHATHLTEGDIALLGQGMVTACFCPTTERDLADGIGPAPELLAAGAGLSLGSDQHAVIDPFEELRGLEMNDRLRSLQRGRFTPQQLLGFFLRAQTGYAGVKGHLSPGRSADLVAVRTDSPRTAGCSHEQIIFAATAGDVDTVMVRGDLVVEGGRHRLGDVGRLLKEAIEPLWQH